MGECLNCTCDVSHNNCDVNCYCDPDCSTEDKKTFQTPLNFVSLINRRNCFKSDPFYRINANSTLIPTSDGLYCLIDRVVNITCNLNFVPIIESIGFGLIEYGLINHSSEEDDLFFSREKWKIGKPILALKSDEYFFLLGLPFSNVGKSCSLTRPILYLMDTEVSCEHYVNSTELCEENYFLNSLTYFNDTKIVENGSAYHAIDYQNCDKELNNCNIGNFRQPIYNSTLQICENVVNRVKYTFFHRGINGIVKSEVKLALENVAHISKQYFEVEFKWLINSASNEVKVMKKSGNPGYLIDHPVIVGILVNDTIEYISHLTFPFTETITCPFMQTINFGESMIISCDIVIEYTNLTDMCDSLVSQTQQLNQLTFNTIGSYGDLDTDNINKWIPIESTMNQYNKSESSFSLCRNVSLSSHLQMRYALSGHRALPQHKIVGASHIIVNSDYMFSCIGFKCKSVNRLVSYRFSVSFINVTKYYI